ncbi:TK protein kinase, partial [Aphelenchoides avenae]
SETPYPPGRPFRPNSTAEWEIAERGLPAEKTHWRIVGKPIDNNDPTVYEFRVRAANSEGFGAYGATASQVSADAIETESHAYVWLCVLAFFLVTIACVATAFLLYVRNQKRKMRIRKEKIHKTISLEQLGKIDFPMEPTLIPPEIQDELRNLPQVSYRDVELGKLLGKGSFGDVYEGTAHNIDYEGGKRISVAIKFLKKGHNHSDRVKFLKEAILMNNFDHPNIVKLLGVSLDNEQHFLLLELMEGGDLHNFLKWSRPEGSSPSHLCLKEMLSMMVD